MATAAPLASGSSSTTSAPLVQPGDSLDDFLRNFWQRQIEIAEREPPTFGKHPPLPLARIKKVMKADPDVRMIASDAPVLFCKACEIFIQEVTCRAFLVADAHKRRTISKADIAKALAKSDHFDFLIDIVPRDEVERMKTARAAASVPAGNEHVVPSSSSGSRFPGSTGPSGMLSQPSSAESMGAHGLTNSINTDPLVQHSLANSGMTNASPTAPVGTPASATSNLPHSMHYPNPASASPTLPPTHRRTLSHPYVQSPSPTPPHGTSNPAPGATYHRPSMSLSLSTMSGPLHTRAPMPMHPPPLPSQPTPISSTSSSDHTSGFSGGNIQTPHTPHSAPLSAGSFHHRGSISGVPGGGRPPTPLHGGVQMYGSNHTQRPGPTPLPGGNSSSSSSGGGGQNGNANGASSGSNLPTSSSRMDPHALSHQHGLQHPPPHSVPHHSRNHSNSLPLSQAPPFPRRPHSLSLGSHGAPQPQQPPPGEGPDMFVRPGPHGSTNGAIIPSAAPEGGDIGRRFTHR